MQCGQNVQLLNVKLVGASRNQKVKCARQNICCTVKDLLCPVKTTRFLFWYVCMGFVSSVCKTFRVMGRL
jgi:hypothetical protein